LRRSHYLLTGAPGSPSSNCKDGKRGSPVFAGRHPGHLFEEPVEQGNIVKSTLGRNRGHGKIRMHQQCAGLLDPYFRQCLFKAFARGIFEKTAERAFRHCQLACYLPGRKIMLILLLYDLIYLFDTFDMRRIDGQELPGLEVLHIGYQRHFPQYEEQLHQTLKRIQCEHRSYQFPDAMFGFAIDRNPCPRPGQQPIDPAEFRETIRHLFDVIALELNDIFLILRRLEPEVKSVVRDVRAQQYQVAVFKSADLLTDKAPALSMGHKYYFELGVKMPEILVAQQRGLIV